MSDEARQGRSIKIKPSILREAHHRAIDSQRRLGEWVEEAIEEKAAREERGKRPVGAGLSGEQNGMVS